MFTQHRVILLGLLAATFSANEAHAQTDNRLALGVSVTSRVASSDIAGSSSSVGFEWRLGHEKQAWGWQTSLFSWFDSEVEQETMVLRPAVLGKLRIRPIMVGYGYTWIRGRAAITTDMVGGFAFNSLEDRPGGGRRIRGAGRHRHQRGRVEQLRRQARGEGLVRPQSQNRSQDQRRLSDHPPDGHDQKQSRIG